MYSTIRDPFGIKNIVSKKDCENLSHRNFNFSVLQSSPSKESIGINRYAARDYLSESATMKAKFLLYAKTACYAYVDQKNYAFNDLSTGIIRHKGTSECKASRVELVNEACISQCPELN